MDTVIVSKTNKPRNGYIPRSKEAYEKLKSFGYIDEYFDGRYEARFREFPESSYIVINGNIIDSSTQIGSRPLLKFEDEPLDIEAIYDKI